MRAAADPEEAAQATAVLAAAGRAADQEDAAQAATRQTAAPAAAMQAAADQMEGPFTMVPTKQKRGRATTTTPGNSPPRTRKSSTTAQQRMRKFWGGNSDEGTDGETLMSGSDDDANGDIVGKIATTATSAGRRAAWEIAKPLQEQKDAERQKWGVTNCEQRQRVGDLALAPCASARNNSGDGCSETRSEPDEEMTDDVHAVAALAAAAEEADISPDLRELRNEAYRALKETNEAELNHIKREFLETVPDDAKPMITRVLDNRLRTHQSTLAVQVLLRENTKQATQTFRNSRRFGDVLNTLPGQRKDTLLIMGEKFEVPLWAIKIAFESKEQAKYSLEAIMEYQSQEIMECQSRGPGSVFPMYLQNCAAR